MFFVSVEIKIFRVTVLKMYIIILLLYYINVIVTLLLLFTISEACGFKQCMKQSLPKNTIGSMFKCYWLICPMHLASIYHDTLKEFK